MFHSFVHSRRTALLCLCQYKQSNVYFRIERTLRSQYRLQSTGNANKTKLTRKERRRREREAKIQAREKNTSGVTSTTTEAPKHSSSNSESFFRSWINKLIPNPRIPGGARELFHRSHRNHLAIRVGLGILLVALVESEDTSPYCIDMAQGPSMLPTFATVGDIYLRETFAWSRIMGIPVHYQKGDLIVFRDTNGRYAGKRIIGIEGDEVLRYGEFVSRYLDRPDLGVTASLEKYSYQTDIDEDKTKDPSRSITVPAGHVWVEGDFPPFSVDSRQYGPIPVDWIRGRILCRLWPFKSNAERLSKSRPEPLLVEDVLSGNYNLFPNPASLKMDQVP